MKKTEVDARLQTLYDQVPTVACKGLCHWACTAIDASGRERQRMREAGVVLPPAWEMKLLNATIPGYRCPALTENHRCAVYEVRPMICRTWGTGPAQACPHGCEIKGEPLAPEQLALLVQESLVVGGHPAGTAERLQQLRAMAEDPEQRERFTEHMTARVVGNAPGPWVQVILPEQER